jgi:hypothetical protein
MEVMWFLKRVYLGIYRPVDTACPPLPYASMVCCGTARPVGLVENLSISSLKLWYDVAAKRWTRMITEKK